MEIMKKEQTGKRKENSNTRKKYVYTKRAQNQNKNENNARKGAAKTIEQTRS